MKEFDHEGLILSEFQGKLFEKSADLSCSSPIFFRRFLHSDLLQVLDNNTSFSFSLDPNEGIDWIKEQFGEFSYGKIKYSKSSLFWIGYMYRYISYTREETTPFIMSIFSYKQMNEVYYVYHTQDPEWAIRSLLEINNLDESIFDINARFKNILRRHYQNSNATNSSKQ